MSPVTADHIIGAKDFVARSVNLESERQR